jgi:AcrR family transcriptional regulator
MTLRLAKLRARSDEDKDLRRRAILAAARGVLERTPVGELTVADVARAAGLGKASVFRYFPSREELILAAFEEELAVIFAQLAAKLDRARRLDGARLAKLLVEALTQNHVFLELATVVHAVLERAISLESAIRFKRALLGHLVDAGARLEARMPGLAPGAGARIFLRAHAMLVGFRQLCVHSPVVEQAIDVAGLDAFRIDFATELEDVLVALLRGMEERT